MAKALQDRYLTVLRDEKIPVTFHLFNGIGLRGTVDKFDQIAVWLNCKDYRMIYKHHISTVTPERDVGTQVRSTKMDQAS